MKKLNGYWVARLVVKILIPVMFFIIAVSEQVIICNVLAGMMVILTLAYYALIWQKIGNDKYI